MTFVKWESTFWHNKLMTDTSHSTVDATCGYRADVHALVGPEFDRLQFLISVETQTPCSLHLCLSRQSKSESSSETMGKSVCKESEDYATLDAIYEAGSAFTAAFKEENRVARLQKIYSILNRSRFRDEPTVKKMFSMLEEISDELTPNARRKD